MREILPKIIGGVVLVAVIGGGAMMVTRHKNTAPIPVAITAPVPRVVATPAPPPPPPENRKYKRDMLGYEATVSPATPVVTKSVQIPEQAPSPASAGASSQNTGRASIQTGKLAHQITLVSSQMKAGERMPLLYSCNQKNSSPPLAWSGAPSGTKSFVVMMEGSDKGGADSLHWGVYNIPASQTALDEALPKVEQNEKGIGQTVSEIGSAGYTGPCIPRGQGTFIFSVYALDTELKLRGGASRNELINAMNGHIIDMAKLPVTHYFRL